MGSDSPLAAPAAGAPPLRTQQGNLFLEHTNYAAADGNLQSCSPLYELKYELNVSPTFRPARSCSRDQFDHTCLETARFVVMLNDLSRLGKAALPYFRDFKLEDTPAGQNPLVAVLKILYDNDDYRPKAPLRNTLKQTFLDLKYDVVFYISTYLEAFERLITHSHRLPVADQITKPMALDRALIDLIKFADLQPGQSDKLCDAYIELFTVWRDKDEPYNASALADFFGSWDLLKAKIKLSSRGPVFKTNLGRADRVVCVNRAETAL